MRGWRAVGGVWPQFGVFASDPVTRGLRCARAPVRTNFREEGPEKDRRHDGHVGTLARFEARRLAHV